MLLWPMLGAVGSDAIAISVTEAVLMINRHKPLVLDVRDVEAYAQGHVLGAKHIPLADLPTRLADIARYRDKPVLLVCQHGRQSRAASKLLKAQQFNQLHLLKGGMDGWVAANLPLNR